MKKQPNDQMLINVTLQSRLKTHCENNKETRKYLQLTKHLELSIPQTFNKAKHKNPRSTKC